MFHKVRIAAFILMVYAAGTNNLFAQNLNTVKSWTANKPITDEADIISSSRTPQEVNKLTEYFDGFGRPVQSVYKKSSPLLKDFVTMHVYDSWGREVQKYLPFASNVAQSGDVTDDGNYKTDALLQQTAFNQGLYPNENYFYTQLTLENSPLNRPLNSYPQGNSWAGSSRGSSVQFVVNTVTDNVRTWNISLTQGSLPVSGGAYIAGQLYKTIAKDERGMQTIEYKDKDGHIVLRKVQNTAAIDNGTGSGHSGWLCTYNVYDDYGNMRFVITPKVVSVIDGTWSVSQTLADELCYRYEYDLQNRNIIKKNPGTPAGNGGEVWMVYDQRNRMVMSQDGNQRSNQKWQYYQYDNLDRPIATGLLNDPVNYLNLNYHLTNAATASVNPSYPNLAFYTTELLSQNYYDNYSWVGGTGLGSSLDQSNTSNTAYFYSPTNSTFPYPQPITQTAMARGYLTGSKTEVLGSGGTQYLYTVNFYDDKGRVIQKQETNITGAVDKTTTQYSWGGMAIRILREQNKNTGTTQSNKILTKMNYGNVWRLQSVTKTISTTINTTPAVTTINGVEKTIATYSYNELGQLKNKTLGTHPTLGTPLETLIYDYNVRGWLTGMNRDYIKDKGISGYTDKYFGFDLGYDNYTSAAGAGGGYWFAQYTGNLTGAIWKSKGDGVRRKYDFEYDEANRFAKSYYNQNSTEGNGGSWINTEMDYSVHGFDGDNNWKLKYDENGNILSLIQHGFRLGNPGGYVDALRYTYPSNSNKLSRVNDDYSDANTKLGDFHDGSNAFGTDDYTYDANGNQLSDANKNIASIIYNLLNLPSVITVTGKGTITFTYDAAGNKLKKQVQENNATVPYNGTNYTTNITTITFYTGEGVYQSKNYTNSNLISLNSAESLQFITHEEGRARIVYPLYGQSPYFAYDYFIRDHLGNIRVTLTDEQQQDTYPAATLESAGIGTEQSFYNITNDASHVILTSNLPWYSSASGSSYQNNNGIPVPPDPTINPTSTSTKLYKLNGATGDRFGMGIALKVMAGDVVNVFGKSVWHNIGQPTDNTSYLLSSILTTFINAFAGTNAVIGGSKGTATGGALNSNSPTTGNLTNLLNNVPAPSGSTPKAYINWILFDDQFKPVQNGSNFDLINVTADVVKTHAIPGISIIKSGYLYIYCSNESNQDVYFDNLQVIHNRGPLIEERHYYPDGLAMFGISSRAFGKLQNNFGYQGKEIQNGEFYDGSGLEEYDFEARYYDPQLGRWWTQDPADQFSSPYNAMGNNWPNGVDPDGRFFFIDDFVINFVSGFFRRGGNLGQRFTNAWRQGVQGVENAARLYSGLFRGNFGQILSRLTWELPQTLVGLAINEGLNTWGFVQDVSFFDGATIARGFGNSQAAFTIGSYIHGDRTIRPDPNELFFQHEYGHYLQSRRSGPLYLAKYAIPSLIVTTFSNNADHFWVEQDANRRALAHWNRTIPGYAGWNNVSNPIDPGSRIRNPRWWEYAIGPFNPWNVVFNTLGW